MTVVVDYKAGNLASVKLALDALGADCTITGDPATVSRASRIIFPGVGAAASAMETLRKTGLDEALKSVAAKGAPFLGICLGTQILFEHSEEDGGVDMLGILPGRVVKFAFADKSVKIPEIGWNQVAAGPHPLFKGLPQNTDFYFVHSYYVKAANDADVIGRTDYAGLVFASAVARGNVAAVQFHPEKSGRSGLTLLKNFLDWRV